MSLFHHAQDKRPLWMYVGLVIVLSYFTYFHGYSNPAAFYWDENYHIASAQKYLNGVYFMEQHPPLGKLFIALGEKILDRNVIDDSFIDTDYGTDLPEAFSFAGYRFFPALMAWMTAPLIFFIFRKLTGSNLWSLLLSFLYIFDNALIVHLRGAMLEPALLFFGCTTILAFLHLVDQDLTIKRMRWFAFIFGVSVACVLTTKVVGLIFALLGPALLFYYRGKWDKVGQIVTFSLVGFLITYIGVWHTHFVLGSTIRPVLPDKGYYQASETYKAILTAGQNGSLRAFPVMLRDSLNFVGHYNGGVPGLDLCKEDENGSPWYFWPVGGRSINYRWETPNGNAYRYLYLQVNPVIWWSAFAGVLLTLGFLAASAFLPLKEKIQRPYPIFVFLALYGGYMAAISRIDRVMYLYHYFLPLLFTFFLLALVILEIRKIGPIRVTEKITTGILLGLAVLSFASYEVYRPFSNYEPITDEAVSKRALLKIWDLHCVKCDRTNAIAVPTK